VVAIPRRAENSLAEFLSKCQEGCGMRIAGIGTISAHLVSSATPRYQERLRLPVDDSRSALHLRAPRQSPALPALPDAPRGTSRAQASPAALSHPTSFPPFGPSPERQ